MVREAIKASVMMRFLYRGAQRHVDPWGLLLERVPYLVGPAVGQSDPFLCRLDRIDEVTLADTGSGRQPSFNLRAYAVRSFSIYQEEPQEMTLRLMAHTAEEVRGFLFHPNQIFDEEPDGSLTVRFRAGGLRELTHHLFTWGDSVEILTPLSLRELMCAELHQAMEQHGKSLTLPVP
ncbi:WYL domain-containing protein [Methylobacterium platani]|uniref:WYL domain-containing protein n=1 Tax=Methylobacterium platani TaxID=427683 RepID=UPI000A88AB96|nr:WYL domain-containing protein [Methylobacterium platani]